MKTLGLPLLLSTFSLVTACDRGPDADPVEGSSSTSGVGSTSGDGSSDEGSSSGGPDSDDPLAACFALPGAAGWTAGEPADPLAGTEAQVAVASAATWDAGSRLMRDVHPTGTVAVSPISMMGSAALAYGRHGEVCGGGLVELVGFGVEGSELHETFGALLAELGQRDMPAIDDAGETISAVELAMTPEIWTINGAIDESVIAPYGATMNTLEGGDLSAMNELINCTIEARTHGILQDFLPGSIPAADTSAVDMLVSYLAAPWAVAFEDGDDLAFEGASGTVSVPRIIGTAIYGAVLEDEDVLVATVPLRGGDLEVAFVMPKSTTLAGFLQGATGESLLGLYEGTTAADFNLDMPRFETPLHTVDVFDPLDITCDPYTVRTILHGASVSMDAAGVAAAGAGAAESWNSGSGADVDLELVLDRPFAFFIVDRPTRALLFGGRFEG